MPRIEPYYVAVCQAERIHPRSGGMAKLKENVERNLERYCDLIDNCTSKTKTPGFTTTGSVKLVTFGEFSITGPYAKADRDDHRLSNREVIENTAIRIPGPETDVLAAKAKERGIYIAAVNHEFDPEWPDLHFNTGFIINPKGKIILKFPKHFTNNLSGIAATAHDVMDKWVNPITKKFDPFPVVDTSIGRLAIGICADIGSPELGRIYSMKGAEVFLHLTSGNSHSRGGSRPLGLTEALKRARAFDSTMYFVNSNWGPMLGATYPAAAHAGYSAVIDYVGAELSKSMDTSEQIIQAKIDIEACREYRLRYNKMRVSEMRNELYAPYYNKTIYPPNVFLEGGPFEGTLDTRQKAVYTQAMANLKSCEDFYSEDDI